MTPSPPPAERREDGEQKFHPLEGEIWGLDFEPEGVTIVQVAIPSDRCPRLGRQRVHLWVYSPMSDDEIAALEAPPMPTDLNPEGVEAAAKAASEERFAAWTHPVFSAWEDEPEDLRESLRVEARAAIRAYQSTIHESSETLPPEMAEFVQRQRERLGVLPEGFHPAAVHASWLAIVDHLLAIIRSGSEGS